MRVGGVVWVSAVPEEPRRRCGAPESLQLESLARNWTPVLWKSGRPSYLLSHLGNTDLWGLLKPTACDGHIWNDRAWASVQHQSTFLALSAKLCGVLDKSGVNLGNNEKEKVKWMMSEPHKVRTERRGIAWEAAKLKGQKKMEKAITSWCWSRLYADSHCAPNAELHIGPRCTWPGCHSG